MTMDKKITASKFLSTCVNLAVDSEKHNFPERYALLYCHLLASDGYNIVKPFKISDLKAAINTFLESKERKIVEKYFGLSGGTIHYLRAENNKDIALKNMKLACEKALNKLRSVRAMYMYSSIFKEYVDLIAAKVWSPSTDCDNVTKANYASLYYLYLLNYHRFVFDNFKVYDNARVALENTNYVLPYFIVEAYKKLFCNLPDDELLIPMIDNFFEGVSPEIKDTIFKYAQIGKGNDVYMPIPVAEVRKQKELLFPAGAWQTKVNFFTLSGIRSISITEFTKGIRANRQFLRNIAFEQVSTQIALYRDGTKTIPVYEYPKGFKFSDIGQLKMYFMAYNFLNYLMPDLPLGKKKIPFSQSSLVV